MKLLKCATFLLLLFSLSNFFAQRKKLNLDSIYKTIEHSADSSKVKKLNTISRAIVTSDPDSSRGLSTRALQIAEKINFKPGIASAYFLLGYVENIKGINDKAIVLFEKSLRIYEELKRRDDISNLYNSIANIYLQIGNKTEAEKNYRKAYEMAKNEPASKYYMAICGVGIAGILHEQKSHQEALKWYLEALENFKAVNFLDYVPMVEQNIAEMYMDINDLNKASEYNDKAVAAFEITQDAYGLSHSYGTKARILQLKGNKNEAILFAKKAYEITVEINALPEIAGQTKTLYVLYKQNGDLKNALFYHEELMRYKDSLSSKDIAQAMAEAETKFYTKQKEAELSEKEKELSISQERVSQRNKLIYVFIAASLLFVSMLLLLYRQSNERKKTNKLLTGQKEEIEKQKTLIEEKNKDITDSIQYSKQIQQAIIPSSQKVKQLLPESFVIFKPKDIVSGDFYLIEEIVGIVYLAVVDCTGHGVPGAMLSVFADSTIKNSLATNGFRNNPGALLSDLCFQFKTNLQSNNSGANVNDGVDMSLCILDKNQKKIFYAGARCGLMRVSNGEVIEYAPNRWGISGTNKGEHMFFAEHEIEMKEGDWFYLHTDGFADQFGGPKGKKYKQKQLHALLEKCSGKNGEEQKKIVNSSFEEWKGNLEQIDDITVIGFKI